MVSRRPLTATIALAVCSLALSRWACPTEGARGKDDHLVTRWTATVKPETCWTEYPRPQLTRPRWISLNGLWDVATLPADAPQPDRFSDKILVPFPPESYLGGYRSAVHPDQRLWYRRSFDPPPDWKQGRILLHFGAVDWDATVHINGVHVGRHRGGYTPFSFDITRHVRWDAPNEIVVAVVDPTDQGTQPGGKQRLEPRGIRYTATSGIWQTVWLEPVPVSFIDDLRVTPNVDTKSVSVVIGARNVEEAHRIEVEVLHSGAVVSRGETTAGKSVELPVADPQLWRPDNPFLYDLRLRLKNGSELLDEVSSYFGMRSITLGQDKNGMTRIMLNGEPLFQFGPLDQGYWPDGLYTPPSDEAMKHELELVKQLGFNMVRKHVKVEPARWYYWCDKLGLLVWQDMPSGDRKAPWPRDGMEITRSPESSEQFYAELKEMVDFCHNSPSVVVWIPFNEAWGQFNTKEVTAWLKQYDPSRLVISASGGNDFGVGDVRDVHFYPGPGAPPAERRRAAVLGEFGGYGLPLEGHTWQKRANWGYRTVWNKEELTNAYVSLLHRLRPLVESHLSAAVYTQLADVETEVNGLLTYDRDVLKIDQATVAAAHEQLLRPLPELSQERRLAAPTLAWWRFEEGEQGQPTPSIAEHKGAIAAYDVSGHNNHLFAFAAKNAPKIGRVTYNGTLAHFPSDNRKLLDDSGAPVQPAAVRDVYTARLMSRTRMDALDSYPLPEWTVELSFALAVDRKPQVILSKRGEFAGTPHPSFQLGVFEPDGLIQVRMIDGSNQFRVVKSNRPAVVGKWYHVAATCDGKAMKLFLKHDGDPEYELQDEAEVEGALVQNIGNWAVGRGFYNGRIGLDAQAWIDEVRISVVARPKEEFLFAP